MVGVSRLVFLNVSGLIWEVSLNHPSVNWLSKLDVDFSQRRQCRRPRMLHVSVPEERGSIAHDVWWTNFRSSGTILRQNCGFVNLNWSTNTAIGDSGHSLSQYSSVDLCVSLSTSCLVRHSQHVTNDTVMTLLINVVSPCWLKHRDGSSAPSTIRLSVVPSCPVPEVAIMLRRRFVLLSEIRSCIGVEKTSERVSGQCVGWAQGLSLGHEGRAIVWISHRNVVVKAAGNHVRLAEVEEQLPWHDLYDSLRETDEQTYIDLSPPGVSRDPQYGGPSTSSDVPMTPVPVPDESMPDVIADEPDISEIPVLPNSVYAPMRNPRVRWRRDALEHPTPQIVLLPVVSSQNVPAATPSWSPPLPITP